jgi:hypothetical protein
LRKLQPKKIKKKSSNYCSSFVKYSSKIYNNHTHPEVKQPSRKMVNNTGRVKNIPTGVIFAVSINNVDNPKPTQVLKHMGQLTSLFKNEDFPKKSLRGSKNVLNTTILVMPYANKMYTKIINLVLIKIRLVI